MPPHTGLLKGHTAVQNSHCRKQIEVSPGAGTGQQTCLPKVCQVELFGSICQRRRASSVKGYKLKLLQERNLNLSRSYQSDACGSHRCPEPGEGSQVNRRTLEEQCKGIPAIPASKLASSRAILNASMQTHNLRSKEEELEACACLQVYDLIAFTETGGMTLVIGMSE